MDKDLRGSLVAAWFVLDMQNRLKEILVEKAPSEKELAENYRLRAVGSPQLGVG